MNYVMQIQINGNRKESTSNSPNKTVSILRSVTVKKTKLLVITRKYKKQNQQRKPKQP